MKRWKVWIIVEIKDIQDLGQDEDEDKFEEDDQDLVPVFPVLARLKVLRVCCVGKCFARGIKVLMYDGTHQNVEELNVGNQIMSKNYSAYYKSTTMLSYFKSVQGRFRVILSKIHGVNPIDSQISAVSWLFAFLFFAGILEISDHLLVFYTTKHEERSNNTTSDMEDAAYLLADLTGNHNSTNLSKTCTKWINGRFDTFRSGAVEQLRVHVALGQNSNVQLYETLVYGKDAAIKLTLRCRHCCWQIYILT
ncbi:hypothetical protein RhiirC2_779783 [Rhizophagus irregularis]|uniref:Uncharacterized protein n=1 Tax=Rhizophagus irregularis TaxID=588596 RepID=A0A2N1N8X3_9GLOM|nr:hypothetical protein RhiirC2_779783 [Rhizophagus irregularis]